MPNFGSCSRCGATLSLSGACACPPEVLRDAARAVEQTAAALTFRPLTADEREAFEGAGPGARIAEDGDALYLVAEDDGGFARAELVLEGAGAFYVATTREAAEALCREVAKRAAGSGRWSLHVALELGFEAFGGPVVEVAS